MTTPPTPIRPTDTRGHLATITALVFRSGMGRAVVEAKWDGLREAFQDFDPEAVASMTPDDVDRLVRDERMIRNRRKIEATIHNAEALLDLEEHHGIVSWLRAHEDVEARARAIRKTFKFLGPASIPEFLWTLGVEGVAECDG